MPDLRRGRIRLSDREVDDGCNILGDHLSLKDDYLSSVKQIKKYSSAQNTQVDHYNHIKEFIISYG